MVLVDSTVWIDFFAGKNSRHVIKLTSLFEQNEDLCICGIILAEVLQGIRNDKDFNKTKSLFDLLIYFNFTQNSFIQSAEIYRHLRRNGITVRNSLDCMIASVAIEHDIPLLQNDRDFIPISQYCGLKLLV